MSDSKNVVEVTAKVKFNLPAFSFLVCFVLLMADWWSSINGATDFFISVFFAAALSTIGWIFVALLIRLAVYLPLRLALHFDNLASLCYLACFGILTYSWWVPGGTIVDVLLTMALSAVLAVPASLIFIFPVRILVAFVRDLFGARKANQVPTIGLISKQKEGTQETQLWIRGSEEGFYYEIRAAYVPAGTIVRSCVLDSGKPVAERAQALEEGKAAYERALQK